MLGALVNMAEAPVAKAGRVEIGRAARRVDVVAGRAAEAGVEEADVHGSRHRRLEARQQAVRGLRLGEGDAVHGDVGPGRCSTRLPGLSPKTVTVSGRVSCLVMRDRAS